MNIFFLSFAGKLLSDDGKLLTDYAIVHDSRIVLDIRGFGGGKPPMKSIKKTKSVKLVYTANDDDDEDTNPKTEIQVSDVGAIARCMAMKDVRILPWLKSLSAEELNELLVVFRDPASNSATKLKDFSTFVKEIKRLVEIRDSIDKAIDHGTNAFLEAYQKEYAMGTGKMNHKQFEKHIEIELARKGGVDMDIA
jgi:hypothetical protein